MLGLCAEAGLVEAGVVAVDGSKFAAAASDSAIRTYEEIAREVLAEAGRIDAAEDQRLRRARGDELPEQLSTRGGRQAWLGRQRSASSASAPPRSGRSRGTATSGRALPPPLGLGLAAEHRENRAYEAYRARG